MAPLVLEGKTLGERHKHYNKLMKDAITEQPNKLEMIDYEDNDIDNLLKIDVACKTKNVDYILEVLKGEDLLYVSRALKRSAWLVTEPQHAHIVNPHHLHQHLFPHMTTKAINKLMLHIRTHLTDEARVEAFYSYAHKTSLTAALKWLPNCSLSFKLDIAMNNDIPLHIFKRMHKKDPTILVKYIKLSISRNTPNNATCVARLLAKSHPEDFLNLVDSRYRKYDDKDLYCGSSTTQVLLKKCPQRIIDNFYPNNYTNIMHIPSLVNYLKKKGKIISFLGRYRPTDCYHSQLNWRTFDNLKHFLNEIPQKETTKVLKYIFNIGNVSNISDKNNSHAGNESDNNEGDEVQSNGSDTHMEETLPLSELYKILGEIHISHPYFVWYQFGPFEEAKIELQKLIYAELTPKTRHSILLVMLACARRVPERLKTVLQYYHDQHINEDFAYKAKFVDNLVSTIGVHNLDEETWNLLDDIYRSMELYIESNNRAQASIKTIIIYKVLHNERVPEIIEHKFEFDTLKMCKKVLSPTDGNKIFDYLLGVITQKIQKLNIRYESELHEIVTSVTKMWNLLSDWKKEPQYYKVVVSTINKLLNVREEISCNANFSSLYKMLGPWRRQLFYESLSLYANEETCLNALKHEPSLLAHNHTELHALRAADAAAPHRLLAKLRIYWPYTLGKEWTEEYFTHINDATGHKAIIKGIILLQPSHKLISFIKKHAPEDNKIEWTEENELQTNIRRHIAKNMHLARPPLSTEVVLWYAKGDYLQYAQLSLNSIYYNLKAVQVNEHIMKLVTGPVSVQKHGIRQAYEKLNPEEVKGLYLKLWKNSKNCTIRTVIFTCTFKLFCKETDECRIEDLWTLLNTYINNLNADDNKIIFSTLGNLKLVPHFVRAKFLMKSYVFLKSLPEKADCETHMMELMTQAPALMRRLDSDFVADVLLEAADEHILKGKDTLIAVLSAYVLCAEDEDVQNLKFLRKFAPILERYISLWVEDRNEKVRSCIEKMIRKLCRDMPKYVFEKRMILPTGIMKKIYIMLDKALSPENDYVLLTTGKLTVDYLLLLEHLIETSEDNYTWIQIQQNAITPFGKICVKHLKEDIEKYFPSIYQLYASACERLFNNYQFDEILQLDLVESFLDENVMESYLLGLALLPSSYSWCSQFKIHRIRKIRGRISQYPSEAVQFFQYRHFLGI